MTQPKDSLPPTVSLAVSTNTIIYHSTSPITSTDTPGTMMSQTSLTGLSQVNQLPLPPIVIPASTTATKTSLMDGFMLFCADQTSPSTSAAVTPALCERWDALSNENKMPYHHQAIIVNAKSEEGHDTQQQHHTTIDSASYLSTTVPRQLVSPEAIRSAELEEKEEALGQHPFSAYPSFLSMKHSHEQQQFTHDSIDIMKTPLPMPTIPIDLHSPSSMTQFSTPSPSPTFSSSLHSQSAFTKETTTSMIISNLLPPPVPQQYYSQNNLEHQHHHNPPKDLHQRTTPKDRSQELLETTCETTKNTQISMASPSNNTSSIKSPLTLPNKKGRLGSASSTTLKRLKRPPNAYLLFNRDMRRKLLALDPKLTVSEISKEIGDRWKSLSPDERQYYMAAAQELKQDHLKNHPDFIYTRRSKAELAQAKLLSKAGKKTTAASESAITLATNTTPSSPYYHDHPPLSPSAASSQSLLQVSKFSLDTIDEKSLYESHRPLPNHQTTGDAAFSSTDDGITTTETMGTANEHPPPLSKKHGRRRSQVGQQQRDPRGRKKKRHKHPTAPKHPMSGFLFFLGAVRPEVAQQFPGSTVGPISKEISARWKNMSAKDREPWLLKAEADKARYAQEIQVYMVNLKQQEQQQQQQQQQHQQQSTASSTCGSQEKRTSLATPPPNRNHGNSNLSDHWTGKQPDNVRNNGDGNDMDVDDQMMATTVVQVTNSGNAPTATSLSGTSSSSGLFPLSYYSNSHLFPSPSFTYPSK